MCVNGLLYILTMYKNHREHYLMFGNGLMFKETSLRVLFKKNDEPSLPSSTWQVLPCDIYEQGSFLQTC